MALFGRSCSSRSCQFIGLKQTCGCERRDLILTREYVRSSPWWGVVKSLALIGAGPVGVIRTQKLQFFLKRKSPLDGCRQVGPDKRIEECPLRGEVRTSKSKSSRAAQVISVKCRGGAETLELAHELMPAATAVAFGFYLMPAGSDHNMKNSPRR